MRQIFYILFLTIAALMMSCTGSDGPKDETGLSQDATFDHAMGVADSLYNCMQFRDAYKHYCLHHRCQTVGRGLYNAHGG